MIIVNSAPPGFRTLTSSKSRPSTFVLQTIINLALPPLFMTHHYADLRNLIAKMWKENIYRGVGHPNGQLTRILFEQDSLEGAYPQTEHFIMRRSGINTGTTSQMVYLLWISTLWQTTQLKCQDGLQQMSAHPCQVKYYHGTSIHQTFQETIMTGTRVKFVMSLEPMTTAQSMHQKGCVSISVLIHRTPEPFPYSLTPSHTSKCHHATQPHSFQ